MKALLCRALGPPESLRVEDVPSVRKPGAGEVRIAVHACGVNFADTLMIEGKYQEKPEMPFSPGMECAGVVMEAGEGVALARGTRVMAITGHGGMAEEAIASADRVFAIPDALTFEQAAGFPVVYGTVYYALVDRGRLAAREKLLVLGAAGGVGSVAVAILAQLGYQVVAATGRPQEAEYLKALGAATIVERKELTEAPDRPLLSERYAGVVDTVSGVMLARALAQLKYGGAAAVCGLAGGPAFPGSILPFIRRGVSMYGIDSVMLPKAPREEAWRRLATDLPLDKLDSTVSEVALGDLMGLGPKILKGEVRGRVVVDVNK